MANHYTTLTFAVQFDGTEDQLQQEVLALGVLADLDIAKIEVTHSFDDGQKVRISSRLSEEDALLAMHRLYGMTDIVRLPSAKMITTRHDEPFDDTALWPEEHVEMVMSRRGIESLTIHFNVAPWFPSGLVQSMVGEAMMTLLRPDPYDPVAGVSTDRTMLGLPTFTIWADGKTIDRLRPLSGMVEEWIGELSANEHLDRWFRAVHAAMEEDDITED